MKIFTSIISFYQKIISPIIGPSCRYYPSCSEYAKWQFELNPTYLAFFNTLLRICRCNKLYIGGIDYPYVCFVPPKKTKINKNIKIKYWIVKSKDGYKAIKALNNI